MFSQLRNVVENIAQVPIHQPRRGSDATVGDGHEPSSRSASLDLNMNRQPSSPLSSSQLAESALSNLRKSFGSTRAASPGSPVRRPSVPSAHADKDVRTPKVNLEDRLRASFAIGDASAGSTPAISSRASSKAETPTQITSPSSVPLPDTPPMSPIEATLPPSPEVDAPQHRPEEILSAAHNSIVEIASPESILTADQVPEHGALVPPKTISTVVAPAYAKSDEPHQSLKEDISVAKSPSESGSETRKPNLNGLPLHSSVDYPASVDTLQERLRYLEHRFAEVSDSFRKLQAERDLTDKVVQEFVPLESSKHADELREYLQNMTLKLEISEDEVKRLNNKLARQEDRIGELRDVHLLESSSQSDQVEQLRKQLSETEALFKAAQDTVSQAKSDGAKCKSEADKVKAEVERSARLAKEEEEKRVKAISLLKTVRQKLVKAEKEKEEAFKELAALKEKENADRGKLQAEMAKLQLELEAMHAEREKAVNGLRSQFDKEITLAKERHEKEVAALRGQFELDAITTQSSHSKEISAKDSRIAALENSVNHLARDKNSFFDQLQMRQAEVESMQSHIESLQSHNTELQYQLRESNDRLSLASENLSEARREQETRSLTPATSADSVARLVANTEAKYETKLADLRNELHAAERERNESESEWSRKLREKSREAEELRRVLQSSAKTREDISETVNGLTTQIDSLKLEIAGYRDQVANLQVQASKVDGLEHALKDAASESSLKISVLEKNLDEGKSREAQLRALNKTLRDELRKVQSSVALLERQRNPGVGYWTTRSDQPLQPEAQDSVSSSASDLTSRIASSPPSSPRPAKDDEEVNLEYLRNVILQFLEHKEMRPNLIKVLSIILHFTPQETRRLIARV